MLKIYTYASLTISRMVLVDLACKQRQLKIQTCKRAHVGDMKIKSNVVQYENEIRSYGEISVP